MKNILVIFLSLILISHAQERVWTSDDGKRITAEFLRDANDAVVLKFQGRETTVPLARLSESDREWLANRREEAAAREKEVASLRGTIKTYPAKEGQQVTFHVYYPTTYSLDSPPPILFLFSASGRGRSILGSFQQGCETLGWVGVGCDTFRNGVDDSVLDPLFTELLPIVEKTIAHDPERFYSGGMSGGASRALHYTAKFDRPWKGVISCGGWLGREFELDYRKKMAVAWVNGDQDKNANSWIDKDTAALEKRQCKTKVFTFPGGHIIGPPDVITDAMKWIDEKTSRD